MNNPAPGDRFKGRQKGSAYGTVAILAVLGAVVVVLGIKLVQESKLVANDEAQQSLATAAAATAQAELAQSKAAAAQFQSSLTKAAAQQADLQTQLDQSKEASSRLQSLADEEKAHTADLQSQLDKAKAQVSDLQTQVSDDAAGAAAVLEQVKGQEADLQSQVKKAQDNVAQLQAWFLKARHLPVTTSFEKVAGGRSFTLHVTNLYAQPLNVSIAITGAVNTRSQKNAIDGGATLDVETLTAGENVVVSSDGYDPVTLSVQ
jgi:hypothetical protein